MNKIPIDTAENIYLGCCFPAFLVAILIIIALYALTVIGAIAIFV